MGKRFRTDHLDQGLLLPPSLHDWLPEGHLARFVADVIEELDLGAVYRSYERDGRGMAAYQPSMMVRLLLYGYCQGVVSSRKIERATHEDVAFRYLSADTHPDHDTIAAFRKRHLGALAGLFAQALQLCEKAGLVKLGHVAIDGTKLKANASKHKAMSYERMRETEQRLQKEVEELLRRAEETDAAEDAQYGKGKRGDELPAELARRESRLKKIREAKAALEREAKEKAERQRAEAEAKIAGRRQQEVRTGKKAGGHDPKMPDPEQAQPEPKAQRNFTDPDSRIMVDGANKGSFIQAYNAQAAVDSQAQVIVAAEITQAANDSRQLVPMIEQVAATWARNRRPSAPTRVTGAKTTLPARAWRESIYTSPRGGRNTASRSKRRPGRHRRKPRCKRRCGTSCEPRPGRRSTKCGRPLSSPSSARPRSGADSGASVSAAWTTCAPNGN